MSKRKCDYCNNTITAKSATGRCGYHRGLWARTAPIAKGHASHRITRLAVNAGILPRITEETLCVDCGGQASEYDHRDYMKPLDVEPVCRGCNLRRGSALNNTKPLGGNKEFEKIFKPINRDLNGKGAK